jgi:hypothetical protein
MPTVPIPTIAMSAERADCSASRPQQGGAVQVPVGRSEPAGQLAHQLLPGDERRVHRKPADQRDDLHVAGLVDGDGRDHRLQGRAPGQAHDLAVADGLVEPLRREVTGRRHDVGAGPERGHAHLREPERVAQGLLQLHRPGRLVVDADLDDALRTRRREHP